MPSLPGPPVDVPVSSAGQAVMTVGVIVGLIVTVLAAVSLTRRRRTITPVLIVIGSLLAAFMMPLPDAISNMWYYRPGQTALWTTYDVSLPVWVFLSYIAVYGGFGQLFWWLTERGTTRRRMIHAVAVLWVQLMITEIVGTQLDTYEYYGPQPFRVAGFPIWIPLYNAAICVTIGVGAARLRRSLPVRQLLVPTILLVPAAIVVGLIGTSFPVLQVTHSADPATWALYLAAIGALALAATMVHFATRFVPIDGLAPFEPTAAAGNERVTGTGQEFVSQQVAPRFGTGENRG